jgi:hypothetical protein
MDALMDYVLDGSSEAKHIARSYFTSELEIDNRG